MELKFINKTLFLFHFLFLICCFSIALAADQPTLVVAQDGLAQYKTISEAVVALANQTGCIIYIKTGIYEENVVLVANNTTLVGDGIGKTIITGNRSQGGSNHSIYHSATLIVSGEGFICKYITIRNTAGPQNAQAVALLSQADHAVFYKCSLEGYQDTLFADYGKQLFRECDVYGITDFIFGDATAVFQNCNIYLRNTPNNMIFITAHGRSKSDENTGFTFHNSTVMFASDFRGVVGLKIYLGRPWKNYSRVVFMKSHLDVLIDPSGWMDWDGRFALGLFYYGEYRNSGIGSSTANRIKYKGYKVIKDAVEASEFSVGKFIEGDSWLPATKVPYTPGL